MKPGGFFYFNFISGSPDHNLAELLCRYQSLSRLGGFVRFDHAVNHRLDGAAFKQGGDLAEVLHRSSLHHLRSAQDSRGNLLAIRGKTDSPVKAVASLVVRRQTQRQSG